MPRYTITQFKREAVEAECPNCGLDVTAPPGPRLVRNGEFEPLCGGCAELGAPGLARLLRLSAGDGECLVGGVVEASVLLEDICQAAFVDGQREESRAAYGAMEWDLLKRGRIDVLCATGMLHKAILRGQPAEEQPDAEIVERIELGHETLDGFMKSSYLSSCAANALVAEWTEGFVDERNYAIGFDPGYVVLPAGERAMARSRRAKSADLAFLGTSPVANDASPSAFRANIGVVVAPADPSLPDRWNVVGWITKQEFAQRARSVMYLPGHWRTWVCGRDLNSPSEFWRSSGRGLLIRNGLGVGAVEGVQA